ncbi:hypothetical protein TD95_003507 [Thielaviopsis punctulata]|uniref:BTB domain-containing protein n=1 Tax=Thielaviopsis punctulata TaxID=72032 RepID=A0A0F4ZGQ6_9PEZI|nr:hypothetical protein TD95_004810 [Thielaviopsis punctulata]KKA30739.1 hypothetical protein TD95_003507 [Thielaviopsis punctulata]
MGAHSEVCGPVAPRGATIGGTRSLHSRSKRLNRSHISAPSFVPQNEFPVFSVSGDVEIIIGVGPNNAYQSRYLLHRHTLSCCSGFFDASLSPEWDRTSSDRLSRTPRRDGPRALDSGHSVAISPSSREPTKKKWCYELNYGSGEDDVPILVRRDQQPSMPSIFGPDPPSSYARNNALPLPSHSTSQAARSAHNILQSLSTFGSHGRNSEAPSQETSMLTTRDHDILRDYDNLFRIFYNYPPMIDGVSIADAYVQCKSLLSLADQYDALEVVGPRVDHHLLQFQGRLWQQIAKYPISYLRLAYMARSKVIFQEALIHVVGKWPAGERSLRSDMPSSVMEIIEDKVADLRDRVAHVESRLYRLTLLTKSGEQITPANSFLDWLVVSLFRQWLATNSTPPAPAIPQNGRSRSRSHSTSAALAPSPPQLPAYGRVYRILGAPVSSGAYLGHDECKRFLKLMPDLYSRENVRRFEKRLDELKAKARELVLPLLNSDLELYVSTRCGGDGDAAMAKILDSYGYLTCTTVDDEDIPWMLDD